MLSAHRAYRLGARPFEIGTEVGPGDFGVAVAPGAAGVSRRHCTIRVEGSRVVLSDHSRFGTRLNGHPIQGSAVLQAGDLIAVGSPPQEFRVVAEVSADGA